MPYDESVNENASPDGNEEPRKSTEDILSDLLRDWRRLSSRLFQEAEEFAKDRPGVALTSTFFIGFILGRMFGRR